MKSRHLFLIFAAGAATIIGLFTVSCGTEVRMSTAQIDRSALSQLDQAAFMALQAAQPASLTEDREYCGYLVSQNSNGFTFQPAQRGTPSRCFYPEPRAGQTVVGLYHTHGAPSAGYDSERPSLEDMHSARQFRLYSYVGTPSGKVWRIDASGRYADLICEGGCIPTSGQTSLTGEQYTGLLRLSLAQIESLTAQQTPG